MILDTFTIETQDSLATARYKLAQQVYANPVFGSRGSFLIGEVSEDFFLLSLFEVYSAYTFNRSTTFISGWFEKVPSGTVIHLTVEANTPVYYLPFLLSIIAIIWQSVLNKVGRQIFISALIIVLPFVFACAIFSIKNEIRFYRNKLRQVFLST
jgi:hypothetical protein